MTEADMEVEVDAENTKFKLRISKSKNPARGFLIADREVSIGERGWDRTIGLCLIRTAFYH